MHHLFHYDEPFPTGVQPFGKRDDMLASSLASKLVIRIARGDVIPTQLFGIQTRIMKKTEASGSR